MALGGRSSTARPAGQPEGPPGCCQGVSPPFTTLTGMDDTESTDPEDGDTEAWEMTWGTAISIPVVLYLLYRVANWLLKALTGLEMDPTDMF